MTVETIQCPECKTEIPITQALQGRIKEELRSDILAEAAQKEQSLGELEEKLNKRERELKKRLQDFDAQLEARIVKERKRIAEEEKKRLSTDLAAEMNDLKSQVKEKSAALREAQKAELELRKRERKLQDEKDLLELTVEKKVSKERREIAKKARESAREEYSLSIRDYENKNKSLKEQVEVLKQKLEQGSQQAQGETLELVLGDLLGSSFPEDKVKPVPKGVSGADVIQGVCNQAGAECGRIIWESKRTKNFGKTWIEKLKADQRKAKADVAVIVSTALPKEVESFGQVDGIWVTSPRHVRSLAQALRLALLEIAASRTAAVGKSKKMDLIYAYLTGTEFRGRVEAIIEGFEALQRSLDKEKAAITKIWAQRERQLESVLLNTAGMYGDLQGISGASLPEIRKLEMKAISK